MARAAVGLHGTTKELCPEPRVKTAKTKDAHHTNAKEAHQGKAKEACHGKVK